jgi:hypothetical protein
MGSNQARKALGRPAHADRTRLFLGRFDLPFDLYPLRLLVVRTQRATGRFIRHPPPQDQEQAGDWIAKVALVAFIYF